MLVKESIARNITLNNALTAVNYCRAFYGMHPIHSLKRLPVKTQFYNPIEAALHRPADKAIRDIKFLNVEDARTIARAFAFFIDRFDKGEYPQFLAKPKIAM